MIITGAVQHSERYYKSIDLENWTVDEEKMVLIMYYRTIIPLVIGWGDNNESQNFNAPPS